MISIDLSELASYVAGGVVLTALFLGMAEYVGFEFMLATAFAMILMSLNQ